MKNRFAGTFLSENIEGNKSLFYTWNEYSPNKVFGSNGLMLGQFMRIKIKDKVYFISDNEAIDAFINSAALYNSQFFITEDIDATDFSDEIINKYFEFIS